MTINMVEAGLKLENRRKIIRLVSMLISDAWFKQGDEPRLTDIFNDRNQAFIAEALERFTADEIADFMIRMVASFTEETAHINFDELDEMASEIRSYANNLEYSAKRFARMRR